MTPEPADAMATILTLRAEVSRLRQALVEAESRAMVLELAMVAKIIAPGHK